jgi:tRNA1(Val) A37 N6-methylase TrmN6
MRTPLTLDQPEAGYRYNRDSFLLARFVRPIPGARLLDAGCGVGAVSISVASVRGDVSVVGLELFPSVAVMARDNAERAGLGDRYRVVVGDIMTADRLFAISFDGIVANPPYYRLDASRPSPDAAKDAARRERSMTLAGLIRVAAVSLVPGGSLTLCMIGSRREEYRGLLADHGFVEARFVVDGDIFLSEAVGRR